MGKKDNYVVSSQAPDGSIEVFLDGNRLVVADNPEALREFGEVLIDQANKMSTSQDDE